MYPIKMDYCPDKDVFDFAIGDWKWFDYSDIERGGIIVRVPDNQPDGSLEMALITIPDRLFRKQGGAAWDITGDEHTGLTLSPSIWHDKGGPNDWHGYIRDGHLVPA